MPASLIADGGIGGPGPIRFRVTVRWPRAARRERWPVLRVRAKTGGGWTNPPGLSLPCKTDDPAAVEQLRADYEARLNAGITQADLNDPTVDGLFALRIAALVAEKSPTNTIKGHRAVRKAIATNLGRCKASSLRKADLLHAQAELFRESKFGGRREESTVGQYMRLARGVFFWAVEMEYVRADCTWPELGRRRKAKKVKTKKRPYTDQEIAAILKWVAEYERGRWLGIFQVLADTGARVNTVLGLRGQDVTRGPQPVVHFRVQWQADPDLGVGAGGWSPLKTAGSRVSVPIPISTAALLPTATKDRPLWPNERDGRRPVRPESVRDVLRKAIAAVGIADSELLDTHSLRRGWVRTAKRQQVPDAIGRRITGHSEQSTYDGYDANSIGDDEAMREAVERIHQARERAGGGHLVVPPPSHVRDVDLN